MDSQKPVSTTCEIPGLGPVVIAVSKRAKYLRITIKPDRTVRLTVPKGVAPKKARQFLISRMPWISKNLQRIKELENNREQVRLPRIGKARARTILIERLQELAEMHDFGFNNVSIRNQKTKWGSCSAKNNISLNMNLAGLPAELRDYVILHELVHTRIKNHSRKFWRTLDEYVGGRAREFSRILKTYRLRV
ncbi:MAG: M48 family metallopeptidase [Planctomycetota bacterium]